MYLHLEGEYSAVDIVVDNVTGGVRIGIAHTALVESAINRHGTLRSGFSLLTVMQDAYGSAQQIIAAERGGGCPVGTYHKVFIRIPCHVNRFRGYVLNASNPRPRVAVIAAPDCHVSIDKGTFRVLVRNGKRFRFIAAGHGASDLCDRRDQLRHDGSYTVIAVRTVLGEVGEQDRVLIIIPFAVRKLTRTLVFVRERFARS